MCNAAGNSYLAVRVGVAVTSLPQERKMRTNDEICLRNLRLFCRAIGADFEVVRRHHYRLYTGGKKWTGESPALSISPSGRFGNNIRQIIHAVQLAMAIRATTLYVGEVNVGNLASPWLVAGLALIPFSAPPNKTVLRGTFFRHDVFKRQFSGFDGARLLTIMDSVVAPMLRNRWSSGSARAHDVLHIHIRSGDIFTAKHVHPNYAPPPVAYYQRVIRHFRRLCHNPKIILVIEDRHNPCVNPLCDIVSRQNLALYICECDLNFTISELLSARNLVTSVGTFATMIALASAHLSRVYAFREIWDRGAFLAKGTKVILVGDAHGSYIPRNAWRNTADQLRQMIGYPETALQIDCD
jgi:hypothetical protein